ncbi:5-formyltetrahydrofolate cyclo-ligase [Brevundimonas sp.]|uniref:5-formyltetrahydrofolate cyclo-ligase n=1 Tax=Brevundimonas sp. TaxID=1871086 RepID=UPI00289F3C91|nr:5-formyltetrahydrofolate cyclo-ligase [Brevundimonas sp.]
MFHSRMDKADIRARMRAQRKLLNTPDAVEAIVPHAADLPSGDVVALYRSIGAEVPTDNLAEALLAQGRTLCLPVVTSREEAMVFRHWSPGDPLEDDLAGCPAPLDLASTVTPDLVITPLVAFDAAGYRLGQGGGYYDRTFAALPDAVRVGLAFAGQQVETLPVEAHDIRLHGVLTENGYRAFV